MEWYRKAAEQGSTDAQIFLGEMYENGWGVDKNDSTAVQWYREAAEQGYAYALFNLVIMDENGWGVVKNNSIAV